MYPNFHSGGVEPVQPLFLLLFPIFQTQTTMHNSLVFYYIYPIFLVMIAIEVILIHRSRPEAFSWKESFASLTIGIGHRLSNSIFMVVPLGAYSLIWQHRLWTIPMSQWWAIPLLFIGIEFCYYWYHRAAHEIRWLWATHAVHHSAQHLNLSASYRLGWTGWLSGNFLFFMPLCWLGFHPIAIVIGLQLNLMYQFWIHTELIRNLGWLEQMLNTPAHHRVHHASNHDYLDCNYGGVLIVFDWLFRTFVAENSAHPPVYGLTHPLRSHNPLMIAFHEWGRLFRDLFTAKTWRDRYRVAFGRPI
jgi:sterol desaturase/sphingolipid hydroxylase (fatty acid hydroxylase superfamily)